MKNARKIVAWVCIFSTLFVGCYSSVIIDPNGEVEGEGKESIDPGAIEYVVTKTDRKYVFDTTPTIVNDTIFGVERIEGAVYWHRDTLEQVQLPMSDVAEVCVSEFSSVGTLFVVGVLAVPIFYFVAYYLVPWLGAPGAP